MGGYRGMCVQTGVTLGAVGGDNVGTLWGVCGDVVHTDGGVWGGIVYTVHSSFYILPLLSTLFCEFHLGSILWHLSGICLAPGRSWKLYCTAIPLMGLKLT